MTEGFKMVTINDIAKLAGVAKSTVSRYLNGGSISTKTADKINAVIQETGYVPNSFAQSLKAKESHLIGAIIPRLDSASAAAVLSGVEAKLRQKGYRMMIANAEFELEREKEALQSFRVHKMDGIIFLMSHRENMIMQALDELEVPVVTIGQHNQLTNAIYYNEVQAGQLLANYLLDMGHRTIDFINVPQEDHAVGVVRCNALKQHFLSVKGTTWREYEADFTLKASYRVTAEQVLANQPNLIVGATDIIAMGAMRAAMERGYRVPEQISFAGFGNHNLAESIYPGLTTIAYPYYEAGELAAEELILQIQERGEKITHQLNVALVIRQSVSKLK